jgi:hypothetical protein
MPWRQADREKYDVIRARYSSDMSQAEFALIAPLPPPPERRGRRSAWGVERTLGWINRARRRSKDFEATMESVLAWSQLALAFPIMRGLARAKIAPA